MEITKFDVGAVFSLSLCIVLMSFAAPMLGLTADADQTNESDIPEFNISSDRFDIAGEFPDSPGTPGTITPIWYNESITGEGINQIWLNGDTSGGTEVVLSNSGTDSNPEADIIVNQWFNGSVVGQDSYTISSDGGQVRHQNGSYAITFEASFFLKNGTRYDETVIELTGDITERDQSTGLLNGIFSVASDLASTLVWVGQVFFWGLGFVFEVALTLVFMLFDLVTFLFGTASWLVGTYTSIISAAPGWSGVIVGIPGLLLFFLFAKFAAVGISLLPTT